MTEPDEIWRKYKREGRDCVPQTPHRSRQCSREENLWAISQGQNSEKSPGPLTFISVYKAVNMLMCNAFSSAPKQLLTIVLYCSLWFRSSILSARFWKSLSVLFNYRCLTCLLPIFTLLRDAEMAPSKWVCSQLMHLFYTVRTVYNIYMVTDIALQAWLLSDHTEAKIKCHIPGHTISLTNEDASKGGMTHTLLSAHFFAACI